jgi:adenosylcobinamide-phosphate synthase
MSFFALLFAFLLEQARPLSFGESLERVSQAWSDKVRNTLDTGDQRHAWTAWAVAIGAPCLLVWAIHMALAWYLGWVFAMVWSVAVLYATLGFRHFSHHFTDIRHALSVGTMCWPILCFLNGLVPKERTCLVRKSSAM